MNGPGGARPRTSVAGAGDVARYYASELLDQDICANCRAVDGTQYATPDDAFADYPTGTYAGCLDGRRCRGTLVAVLAHEQPVTMP